MIVGLDLDNTIVDCDALFQKQAEILLGRPLIHLSREAIRDLIREERGDHYWTQIQAEVYGPLYQQCQPCLGALETIVAISACPHVSEVMIISHKTLTDSAGKNYKLRDYATTWIKQNFLSHAALSKLQIYFAATIDEKRHMIVNKGCDIFLDDLLDIIAPLQNKILHPVLFSQKANDHPLKDNFQVCDWFTFGAFVSHG